MKRFGEKAKADWGSKVVFKFMCGFEYKGHTLVIDNFFTSTSLFERLLHLGIWDIDRPKDSGIGFLSSH